MTVSEKITRLLELESRATPAKWEIRRDCFDEEVLMAPQAACYRRPQSGEVFEPVLEFGSRGDTEVDANLAFALVLRNASRPLLLALQALLRERFVLHAERANGNTLMSPSEAIDATDVALKELEDAASLANGLTEYGFTCDGAEITAIWDRLQSGADAASDPVAMMLADAMKGKERGE